MTTREEAEMALATVDAMRERAIVIAKGAPYAVKYGDAFDSYPEEGRAAWAWVEIEDDVARLWWPTIDHGWEAGDACISGDGDCIEFPAALLFVTNDELAAWQAAAKDDLASIMADTERIERERVARERETADRATYERLKAKYEGKA